MAARISSVIRPFAETFGCTSRAVREVHRKRTPRWSSRARGWCIRALTGCDGFRRRASALRDSPEIAEMPKLRPTPCGMFDGLFRRDRHGGDESRRQVVHAAGHLEFALGDESRDHR